MQFKKILSGVTVIAVAAACLSFTAFAETNKSGDYEYQFLFDDKVSITGYSGQDENLVIPVEIDGRLVTQIGYGAFRNYTSLVTVEIPETVTSIGEEAFANCTSLAEVEIADGVQSIGSTAFRNCPSLAEIDIPVSVTSIGGGAFANCSSLTAINVSEDNKNYTSVDGLVFNKDKTSIIAYPGGIEGTYDIPDSVTSMGNDAFRGCSLTKITIPDSITKISSGAFSHSYSLEEIVIPETVTEIGGSAFFECFALSKIKLPEGITIINDSTFRMCYALTSINIPDSVTKIGKMAFQSCKSLAEIDIPDGVTEIGDEPFDGCNSLTAININENNQNYKSVDGVLFNKGMDRLINYPMGNERTAYTVPDSVTSIGGRAFSGCTYLESLVIPDSVKTIGYHAFSFCSALTSIRLPSGLTEIAGNLFMSSTALENVNIPDSVTTIGANVFVGTAITEITIPDGVTAIKSNTFWYCTSLTKIVIPDSVTEIADDAFNDCSSDLTIYGCIGSYAETYAKEHGIKFADIEEEPVVTEPETTTTPETQPEDTTTTTTETQPEDTTTTTTETQPEDTTTTTTETQPEDTTTTTTETQPEDTTTTTTETQPEVTTTTTTAQSENTTTAPTENLISEDKATGVQLLAANGVIPADVDLNVKIGAADITTNAHIYVLDITLVNAQGAAVQPNGSVTVKIPLPEGFEDSGTYYVYYQDDDGKLTDMHATFTSDGYVTFTTNHFSTYILTTEKLNDDAIPNTGVVILIIPALAAAAGIVISRKRK